MREACPPHSTKAAPFYQFTSRGSASDFFGKQFCFFKKLKAINLMYHHPHLNLFCLVSFTVPPSQIFPRLLAFSSLHSMRDVSHGGRRTFPKQLWIWNQFCLCPFLYFPFKQVQSPLKFSLRVCFSITVENKQMGTFRRYQARVQSHIY